MCDCPPSRQHQSSDIHLFCDALSMVSLASRQQCATTVASETLSVIQCGNGYVALSAGIFTARGSLLKAMPPDSRPQTYYYFVLGPCVCMLDNLACLCISDWGTVTLAWGGFPVEARQPDSGPAISCCFFLGWCVGTLYTPALC